MGDTTTDTTKTETTTTETTGMMSGVLDTVKGWFSNEIVKLVAAGVGGFAAGYTARMVQNWFTK